MNLTIPLAFLAGALLMTTGCGSKAIKLTGEQTKAFDPAPAEVKQTWEKALVADKANDYANANKLLESLNQMALNEPQRLALDEERAAFGQRLMQAAEKNNPAAIRVLQASRKGRNRK